MKRTAYIIGVQEPCRADWTAMEGSSRERHCAQCARSVTDFTRLTDEELVAALIRAGGKPCGRFREDQLNRVLPVPVSGTRSPFLSRLVAGALLLITSGSLPVFGQKKAPTSRIAAVADSRGKTITKVKKKALPKPAVTSVQGRVLDEQSGKPLPAARVMIQNTKLFAFADDNGEYSLTVPDSLLASKVMVRVMYAGHKSFTYEFHPESPWVALFLERGHDPPPPYNGVIVQGGALGETIGHLSEPRWWERWFLPMAYYRLRYEVGNSTWYQETKYAFIERKYEFKEEFKRAFSKKDKRASL